MRQWMLMGCCLLIAGLAQAQDQSKEALEAQKEKLEAEKQELKQKQSEIRDRLMQTPLLQAAQAAADQAQRDYAFAKATYKPLQRAEDQLVAAQAVYSVLADILYEQDPEVQKLREQIAQQQDLDDALKFQLRAIDIQLRHDGSPVRRKAEAQADVAQARQAWREAQAAETPEAVQQARQAYVKARAKRHAIEDELLNNKELQKLQAKIDAARATLDEARAADSRRAVAEQAKEAYDKIRESVYQKLPAAQPKLKDLAAVRTELAAISTARDATEHLRDVVRASIAEGDNKQVAEARKQLEKAQQAYDKILQQDKFAEAAKAVEEAHQNYDKQHKKLFEGLDEYSKLSAQQDKLQQQLDALNKQTLKVKSADEVQKLASQAGELQQQIEDLYWQKREIRISVGKDLWDDVWHARGRKQDALNDLVDADPKASAARAKVKQAERELAAAVDQAVQEDQSARTIRAVLQDLDDKRSALRYQEDLLEHQLEGRGAPIREQVERDPAVASLRQAWQIQERQIRNNPTEAEQKAEQQYESLRAEADALRRELRDNEKLEQARQAEREARDAMRQAEREDKTRDAEKEARQSYEQKLEEVRRELPEAKELVATGRQLSEQREAVRNRIKNLRNELKDAREKIAEAGTGRIAEAREAVSAARLEVQEAERADELQVLRVRADVARKEVRDQAGFVLGLGAGMAESDARIRQIDKELREIKRQLR